MLFAHDDYGFIDWCRACSCPPVLRDNVMETLRRVQHDVATRGYATTMSATCHYVVTVETP